MASWGLWMVSTRVLGGWDFASFASSVPRGLQELSKHPSCDTLLWHPLSGCPSMSWVSDCSSLGTCISAHHSRVRSPPVSSLAPALPIPSMASLQPLPVLVILNTNVFQILISIPKPCPEILPIKEPPEGISWYHFNLKMFQIVLIHSPDSKPSLLLFSLEG